MQTRLYSSGHEMNNLKSCEVWQETHVFLMLLTLYALEAISGKVAGKLSALLKGFEALSPRVCIFGQATNLAGHLVRKMY